jgi:hypothetical protein
MPCCSTGRDTQRLTTPGALTLQEVTDNGNTSSHSVEFEGSVETHGFFIGDGSQLTNLPGQGTVNPTLQQVTTQGASTTDTITFSNLVTSFQSNGNVVATGNVTALKFFGDGLNLTSVAKQSDLNDNSSRLDTLSQKTIITNTSGITTDFTKGDILYASSNGILSKLPISLTANTVLTVNAFGLPEWTDGSNAINSNFFARLTSLESNIMLVSTSGIDGFTKGDILYASATNTLSKLPIGNAGQFLVVDQTTGIPTWSNGPGASTQFITESYTTTTTGRIGFHNTNPQHDISFGTSYMDFKPRIPVQTELTINGNVYANLYYGDGTYLSNITVSQTSDIRLKTNVITLSNSLDTLSNLKPVIYEKNGLTESGFIAQDIYYDTPELRHLVKLGKDANPNETKNEPNYEDWGEEHAKLDYVGLIAYTVAAINELREMVEELENA